MGLLSVLLKIASMKKEKINCVKIVGGGLAGAEAALYLASKGVSVKLYDIKPLNKTPAHTSDNYAELVCSNSLKSNDVYGNAAGLLKEEMRLMGSIIISVADNTKVPAGNALAVNRELFSEQITNKIKSNPYIECINEEVCDLSGDLVLIATGPLTTEPLSKAISSIMGSGLHFYDASAPVVTAESIDPQYSFVGDRYDKGNGDHINCPMNKEEYTEFYNALISAERAELKEFEKSDVFEGCMPVEIMAKRGVDTLRFGPLKPVGLTDPKTGRWAYATLQLRKEDFEGTMYNLVGFQTNLKFPEQKRVFGLIPALKNAEFVRYGVMYRNTYVNSPEFLNIDLSLKDNPNVYFAGQITGVEGYVESAVTGLVAGIQIYRKLKNKKPLEFSDKTVTGALLKYITTKNQDFQPMNANFALLPPPNKIIRDKKERKAHLASISLDAIKKIVKEI